MIGLLLFNGFPLCAESPSRSDQIIQSGDNLYIAVSPADELSRELIVDQNGKISVPLAGAVQASGVTTELLGRQIVRELSRYVADPKVDVFIRQSNSKQVGISGQIGAAGSYALRPNMRLLDLISLAGGLQVNANRKKIRILRRTGAERRTLIINIDEVLASRDPNRDIPLEAGDIIDVPRGSNGVSIFGEVEMPGIYDYFGEMRLLDLVSLCRGFRTGANLRRIMLIRGEPPNQKTTIIHFSSVLSDKDKGNVRLAPGDVVFIPQRSLWAYSSIANVVMPFTALMMTAATIILVLKK